MNETGHSRAPPFSRPAGSPRSPACSRSPRKPGNVHRFLDFKDLHFVDFLLSATAIAAPLDRAVEQSLGATILAAVEATREVVSTNTNLGMILLLAPLAAVPRTVDLAEGVERSSGGDDPRRRARRLPGDPARTPGRARAGVRAGRCGRPERDTPRGDGPCGRPRPGRAAVCQRVPGGTARGSSP